MAEVLLTTSQTPAELNKSTSQQKPSEPLKPLTAYKLKQKRYEKVFDFIDPLTSLLEGLYKYKEETDRKVLHILSDKIKKSYGENAKFKDTASALKYAWKIEDGEPISSLEIDKDDLYEPNKETTEVLDVDEPPRALSQEELRKKNKSRPNVGATSATGNAKAPNLEYTCKVCMDQPVPVTFIPCGHLVVCGACAPALGDCPVCRQTIKETIERVSLTAETVRTVETVSGVQIETDRRDVRQEKRRPAQRKNSTSTK